MMHLTAHHLRVAGNEMIDRSKEILVQAIERNVAAVLSLPSAGMFRHYKTRFLHDSPDGVWIEGVTHEQPLIDSLIRSGQPAGVSFRSGQQKVNFAVPILQRDAQHQVNATTVVQALLLQQPAEIKAIQRRSHYRAPVHEVDKIAVQVWRIAEHAAIETQPSKLVEVKATVHNLSVGGLGVMLNADGGEVKLATGERVRLVLRKTGNEDLLIEGRAGPLRPNDSGQIEVGIQFTGLQDRLEGRQILTDLTRIVGALQREEVKRTRQSRA